MREPRPEFAVPVLSREQAAQHREVLAQREAQAVADLATLGEFEFHLGEPRRCQRCVARVFTYALTPDGARAYCRCVRSAK